MSQEKNPQLRGLLYKADKRANAWQLQETDSTELFPFCPKTLNPKSPGTLNPKPKTLDPKKPWKDPSSEAEICQVRLAGSRSRRKTVIKFGPHPITLTNHVVEVYIPNSKTRDACR